MSNESKGFVGGLFRMAKRLGSYLFPFELFAFSYFQIKTK